MKRFALALPVVAAMVFFCLPVDALDVIAAQTSKILPEPDVLKVPWWMPLVGVLIAGFRTFFSDSTKELPTIVAGWRTAIVALLAAAGTFIEQLIGGFDFRTAALTFVMLGVPSIAQEVLKALFSGKKPSSGSDAGAPGGTGIRPPPGDSVAMRGDIGMAFTRPTVLGMRPGVIKTPAAIGVAIGACALMLSGCAWFKGNGCKVLRMAADACDTIVVVLPDGSEETVPASAVAGMAMQARAARIAGSKSSDAGANQ